MEARDPERAKNRSHHAATCYPVPGASYQAMTGLGAQRLGTIGVPNPSVPMRRRVRGDDRGLTRGLACSFFQVPV